jgi:hypothetical protein
LQLATFFRPYHPKTASIGNHLCTSINPISTLPDYLITPISMPTRGVLISMKQFLLAGALALTLAACGGSDKAALDTLDGKLTGKGEADPALTAALEDQIMVDPALSGQSNKDAIRPASQPYQAPIPATNIAPQSKPAASPTLGSLAEQQAEIAKDSFNGCGLDVQYSADYAARLPTDLPLYPQAQVSEAAGSEQGGCKLRAVSHSTAAGLKAVAVHYASSARKAGYRVTSKIEGKGVMVSGKRAADGGAFYVILSPASGGTIADLVVNNGI